MNGERKKGKTMKRKSNQKESFLIAVWTLMMTMAIPTLFISCGDDKEENALDERLMGTWHRTLLDVWEYKNDVLTAHWQDLDGKTERVYEVEDGKETGEYRDFQNTEDNLEEVTFNSDGTVVSIVNKSETTRDTFETSNGAMTVTLNQGEVNILQYDITDGQLVITSDNRKEYDEEGYSYFTIAHYQRGGYLQE